MFVGRLRFGELAGGKVDVEMPLARSVDAVSPVEPCVEPLRRVGRCHLHRQHVDELIEEGASVRLRIEIAALPTPIGPGAGEPLEDLFRRMFAGAAFLFRKRRQRRLVGGRAPQPRGNGLFLDLLQPGGHPRLAEVFLGQYVGGDLRPEAWHLDIRGLEHHRAVGIADLAFRQSECDVRVRGLFFFRVSPLNPHRSPLVVGAAARADRRRVTRGATLASRPRLRLAPTLPSTPLPTAGFCGTAAFGRSRQQRAVLRRRCGKRSGYADPFRRALGGTSNHSRRTF